MAVNGLLSLTTFIDLILFLERGSPGEQKVSAQHEVDRE